MKTATFRTEVHEQLERIGQADIIVGIPSFNNARTIGHVVRAVQAGLAKYFPDHKAVIVNSDGGSSDGTMDVVRNTSHRRFQRDTAAAPRGTRLQDRLPLFRHPRQRQRLPHHLRDRRGAGRKSLRRRRFRSQEHHAGMDRAAGEAGAGGRLRLRVAALSPPQVRRHHHQQHRLSAHPRALRQAGAPADRRRFRLFRQAWRSST